jgi:hypothetical protein
MSEEKKELTLAIKEHKRLAKLIGFSAQEQCALMNGCKISSVNGMMRRRMEQEEEVSHS